MASLQGSWYASFGNAAQLGFLQGQGEAGAALQLWEMSNEVDKTTNINAGVGLRFGNLGVALGGVYQMGVQQGTFTPSDRMVSLGVAYQFADVISVGVNARLAGQSFSREASVSGYSVDLTVLGRVAPGLSVAAGVGNLGSKVKGSVDYYGQPAYAHAGLSWALEPASGHSLEAMADAEYNFDGTLAAAIGLEYFYNQMIYARAGYRMASEKALIPSHLGIGLGARFQFLRVEASYLTASPVLGNTLNLGVGINF